MKERFIDYKDVGLAHMYVDHQEIMMLTNLSTGYKNAITEIGR